MTEQSRPIRRRKRPAFSCVECRRRKVKCDHAKPCKQCVLNGSASSCTYEKYVGNDTLSTASQDRQTSVESPPQAKSPSLTISGTISKTRVYGFGHWMSAAPEVKGLAAMQGMGKVFRALFLPSDDVQLQGAAEKFARCKNLAREVKRQRPSRQCLLTDIHRLLPDRSVIDTLIDVYFSTFESCYRILHRPQFLREYSKYAERSETADAHFLLQLVLIVCITWPLHPDRSVRSGLSESTQIWIQLSQTWLSAPMEKDRLTLKGIQVYCLLLIAQQVSQVSADLVWISAGSLQRMAMQMGLHQDPSYLGETNGIQCELRRRLWYTILEINVQSSLDAGMSPIITEQNYNTRVPSSIDDDDLDDTMSDPQVEPMSPNAYQASLQMLLATSLPFRSRIATLTNSMNDKPSYEQILELGQGILLVSRDLLNALERLASSTVITPMVQFAHNLCIHLLRRFSLCLHYRYALNAYKHPLYDFSRRMCLEATLDIVSLLDSELYSRVLVAGSGMFRDILNRGALTIFVELGSEAGVETSCLATKRNRGRQEDLLREARKIVDYSRERMYWGETNIKIYVCMNMMLAQATARFEGGAVEEVLATTLQESLDECEDIMREVRARRTQPEREDSTELALLDLSMAGEADWADQFTTFWDDMSPDFELSSSLFAGSEVA